MRILIVLLFVFNNLTTLATDPVTKIAKANKAKELASAAFGQGDYQTAVDQYNYVIDTLGYADAGLKLNRAHAYYHMNDTLRAYEAYRKASMVDQKPIQSTAFNQLGVLSEQQGQKEEALSYYKESLRADPRNEEARYNYELLKKKIQEEQEKKQNQDKGQKKPEDQQQQKQGDQDKGEKSEGDGGEKSEGDQENAEPSEGEKEGEKQKGEKQKGEQQKGEEQKGKEDGGQSEQEPQASDAEQEGKEGDKQDAKPSTSDKLKAMNVSEEKAKQILEALRNKEAQYLQQMRKRATKKKDTGKPDW